MKPSIELPDYKNRVAFGLLEELVNKYKKNESLVIGVTGAGGAGKTTFAGNIVLFYGSENCVSIDLDDYLISRADRGKQGLTGYNPKANNLVLARQNILDLISGKEINKPKYDHTTGTISESEMIKPKPLIIIEGVTTLYDELKDLNTLSFYLDAPETTQIQSRIKRDVETRGYTLQEALTLMESVRPDYQKYIEPTREHATVVFNVGLDYVMHLVKLKN